MALSWGLVTRYQASTRFLCGLTRLCGNGMTLRSRHSRSKSATASVSGLYPTDTEKDLSAVFRFTLTVLPRFTAADVDAALSTISRKCLGRFATHLAQTLRLGRP